MNKAATYILRCADNKLYVGSTTNIEERLKRHKAGYASKFTRLHKPVELVYKEEYNTYQEAFRRERQLKKWTLAKKEALIAGDIDKLKELSKSKWWMQNFLSLSKEQGDVPVTYADTTPLEEDFGYKPNTPLREGLRKFATWYKKYYI